MEPSTNTAISCMTSNISLLNTLNDDMFQRLAPVIAVLAAFMIVGTIGNILICYIFIKKIQKSSQNFLLLCLGTFDLLSSCVGVPSEIADIRHYYLYESAEACKAMRFLTTFPSLASIMVLLVIAADRYRKVCKPLNHQIHLFHAKIAVVIIIALAVGFSVPALFLYGHRTLLTPIPGEFGCDCSIADIYKDQKYSLIYEGTFLAAFVVSTSALVFIYARIWFEARRHLKYMKAHAIFGSVLLDEAPSISSATYDESTVEFKSDISHPGSGKLLVRSTCRKRFYNCLHRKGRRKSESMRGGDEAIELKSVKSTVSVLKLESEKIEGEHSEFQLHNLQATDVEQDEKLNQMYGHEVMNKQANVSPVSTPHFPAENSKSADHLTASCVTPQTNVTTTGMPEGTILLENIQNCESSTDDGDLHCPETIQDNSASTLHLSCSLDTFQSKEDSRVPLFHFDQENHSSKQLQGNHNAANDSQLVPVFSAYNNRNTESKCCDDFSILEYTRSIPFNTCTDIHQFPRNKEIIDSLNSFPESSSQETSFTQSEFDMMLSDSDENVQVSDDQLQEHVKESVTYANKPARESCLFDTTEKSQEETEYLSLNKPSLDSEKNNDYNQQNCSQSQDDHLPNATSLPQNVRTNRVSFANELNYPDYIADMDNSQERRFSAEISTPEIQSHKLLKKLPSTQSLLTAKRARRTLRAARTTIIAFVITIGFILSYLPHLILVIIRSVRENYEHDLQGVSLIFYNIFLRSYFVNNVINVFVYGCMHLEFRSQIASIWKRTK